MYFNRRSGASPRGVLKGVGVILLLSPRRQAFTFTQPWPQVGTQSSSACRGCMTQRISRVAAAPSTKAELTASVPSEGQQSSRRLKREQHHAHQVQLAGQTGRRQALRVGGATVKPSQSMRRKKYTERKGEVIVAYQQALKELRAGQLDHAEELLRRCLTMDRKDARSWLQLAQLANRRGRQEDAQSYYAQGVCECPESVHLLQSWALLEHKSGNLDKACSLFERGMALDPGNPYIAHAWGQLQRKRGNNMKARELYMDSLRLYGPWAQVYMALAELEVETGNAERARDVFQEALQVCTQDKHKLLVAWAKLEEANFGDWEKATDLLHSATQLGGPKFTDATVALAHLEMKKGNKCRAVEILKNSSYSSHSSLFNTWASVEAKAGNVDTAIQLLEEACDMFPDDFSLLQTLGTLEVKRRNFDRARGCFARSAAIRPHVVTYNAWAIMEERLAQEMKGAMRELQIMRARKLFMLGMSADPSHGPLYNAYGRMEERIGNFTGARSVFQLGVEARCPDMPSVINGWAMLAIKERNYNQARELLRQGLTENKLGKNVGFLYHTLGMLELRLGRLDDAWSVFEEAIDKYPRNSQLLVGGGLVAEKRGQHDKARDLFRRGVECDRLHHQAWQAWAVLEHRQGNVAVARDLFRMGIKGNPSYGALWQAYGVLEFHEDKVDQARALFEEGLRRDPRHVMLHQAYAVLEVKMANYDKARDLLRTGLRIDPHHGACWSILGYIHEKCQEFEEARSTFETGVRHAPDHAPLFRVYGDFERRQGNMEAARQLYEKSIGLDADYEQAYVVYHAMELQTGNAAGAKDIAARARKVFGEDYSPGVTQREGGFRYALNAIGEEP